MSIKDWFFGPSSERKFAELTMDALRTAGDERGIQYEPEQFRLKFTVAGEPAGYAFLRNVFDEYKAAEANARDQVLSRFVRASLSAFLKEIPEEFEDARPDILPVIRTKSYLEFMRLRCLLEGQQPAAIPHMEVSDYFVLILVYDRPDSMALIDETQLETWRVTFYEAIEAAGENLAEIEFAFASISSSLYASVTGDNYDPSRLLLDDLVESLEVKGTPVAMLPNLDTLLIAGTDDLAGLEMMIEFARTALAEPRPMYALPLILDEDDQWQIWQVPKTHQLANEFQKLQIESLGSDYADQKELLDQLFEAEGKDIHVATLNCVKNVETGEVSTYCVWAAGATSLLPKADRIAFVGEDETVTEAQWQHVLKLLGHQLQQTQYFPPRYLVKEFPTPQQLEFLTTTMDES